MKNKGFDKILNDVLCFLDLNDSIRKIFISNFYADEVKELAFRKKDGVLYINIADIPELVYGNYGFFYESAEDKTKEIAVLSTVERDIYKKDFSEDKYTFYRTKGGNLALRVRPLSKQEKISVSSDFLNLFKENNVYFQQNLKYDKLSDSYKFDNDVKIEQFSQLVKTHGKLFSIGMCSYVKDVDLPTNTRMGRYCSIAPGVRSMGGGRHPQNRFTTSPVSLSNPSEKGIAPMFVDKKYEKGFVPTYFKQKKLPIIIGNDVWIGNDVIIKQGVKVGNGAIIAQGSIVTKNVPPYALVAGVPGVVKRYRFSKSIIDTLQKIKWWEYAYWDFDGIYGADKIEVFLDKFQKLIDDGNLKKHHPKYVTGKDILRTK